MNQIQTVYMLLKAFPKMKICIRQMKLTLFLDDRYGRSVVVTDYFPDVKKFIKSVKTIQNLDFALLKNCS